MTAAMEQAVRLRGVSRLYTTVDADNEVGDRYKPGCNASLTVAAAIAAAATAAAAAAAAAAVATVTAVTAVTPVTAVTEVLLHASLPQICCANGLGLSDLCASACTC